MTDLKKKKLRKLYPKFKKLYGNHGFPFICRELNLNNLEEFKFLKSIYMEKE